jgi:hypothetical protein
MNTNQKCYHLLITISDCLKMFFSSQPHKYLGDMLSPSSSPSGMRELTAQEDSGAFIWQ